MNPYANQWPPQGQYNPHVYIPPGYYNQPYYNDQPKAWQGYCVCLCSPLLEYSLTNMLSARRQTIAHDQHPNGTLYTLLSQ